LADNSAIDFFGLAFTAEVDVVTMSKKPDLLILKLMQKLGDIDPLVRRNAAGALRLQGSRAVAAIPALSALLTDQDSRVRNEAERAIDHLRLAAA
jgi:HEAT repeat protein